MVAACPFPVNYGSPGAVRELALTLSEMGHNVHIVTYPEGQDLRSVTRSCIALER